MITTKTEKEIAILREGGKRHAFILAEVAKAVRPGVTTAELNALAEKLIAEGGDKAAFLDYQPAGAKRPYPASLCVSVNDEIVHGIPNEKPKTLKEGDIVSLDLGLIHKGLITDAAVTVPVGKIDAESAKLLEVTEKALALGIAAAGPGKTTGDIGFAIESYVKPFGLGIVQELCGHGVGYSVHEDPFVPNYGVRGRGSRLKPGNVIAIEPIFNFGSRDIKLGSDGYTYRTIDGSRSAHFEHTVVITDKGIEILTKLQ
jgi:methionyl aminopeptidase